MNDEKNFFDQPVKSLLKKIFKRLLLWQLLQN